MNLKSVEYFLVVAKEGNITRAAERLFISQQALSSHIQRLEDEYHVTLLVRRPALHLTEEGKQFVSYGQRIIDAEKRMRVAFSDISQNCRGSLTVGMSRLRGTLFFPRIWNHYHTSHSNISVELVDGNTTFLNDLLQKGKLDFYIGVDAPIAPNTTRVQLATERLQCCFSLELLQRYRPDDWLELLDAFKKGVDVTQIIDIPFIAPRTGNRLRDNLDQFFGYDSHPTYVFESDHQDLIYNLAKQGQGVGVLSPVILYQSLEEIKALSGSFYCFPVKNSLPAAKVYLVYRNDYPVSRFAMDCIQTSCMVFRNYSQTIEQYFT